MESDIRERMTADTRARVEKMSVSGSPAKPETESELVSMIRDGYRQVAALAGESSDDIETNSKQFEYEKVSLPVRMYRPESRASGSIVFFHGGGFVSGGFETHERVLQRLAALSLRTVIAVEYRLAPEHPFPAAPNDCLAALQWLRDAAGRFDIDPNQIAVGGDSAGGALVIAVCLMCREQELGMPEQLVLACPNTDLTLSSDSWNEMAALHPAQSRDNFAHQMSLYVRDSDDLKNPLASPSFAESLTGFPPMLVITAELDPQRDEAEAFASKLCQEGVLCTVTRYPSVIHGFWQLEAAVRSGNVAVEEMAAFVKVHSAG